MKYTPAQYAKTLYDLVSRASAGASRDLVSKFVKTLTTNGDLAKGEAIVEEFEKIWRAENGSEKIEVTAAQKEDLAMLKEKLKGEVQVTHDPKVLGGVKIRIGDKLIDNTLRARINRLKESLKI